MTREREHHREPVNPQSHDDDGGHGDYARITASPKGDTGMGGQVACLVADDGCFVLPSGATSFLLASRTREYSLSVERHRYRSVRLEPNVTLDVDMVTEHRITLLNGVSDQ